MGNKKPTGRKTLKLAKDTVRTLAEKEVGDARGGRYADGPQPPSSVRTMNHNQRLLRVR